MSEMVPLHEMSEATKLRVAIQMYANKYPRGSTQEPGNYCFALSDILRAKKKTSMERTDLAVLVDKVLFEPLYRPRKVYPELVNSG